MLLKDYVPNLIANSKPFSANYNAQQAEIDNFNIAIADIINQCFIDTATWGLDYWETFAGLALGFEDYEARRIRIKSVIRGFGTISKFMLQNLLKAMPYGDAEIIEAPSSSTFKIKFNNYFSIPINIPDILKTVDMIKPAHLTYNYTFAYNWWDGTAVKTDTWNNVGTWGNFRTYEEVL